MCKIAAGYYTGRFQTPQGEVAFNIVRREDGRWYWVNAEDADEGGDDLFPTKVEAVAALIDYCQHRAEMPGYGFCYVAKQ